MAAPTSISMVLSIHLSLLTSRIPSVTVLPTGLFSNKALVFSSPPFPASSVAVSCHGVHLPACCKTPIQKHTVSSIYLLQPSQPPNSLWQ